MTLDPAPLDRPLALSILRNFAEMEVPRFNTPALTEAFARAKRNAAATLAEYYELERTRRVRPLVELVRILLAGRPIG